MKNTLNRAQQVQREAARFAALILADLGLDRGGLDFGACWRACCEHGGEPIVTPTLPRKAPGFYLDGHPFDADIVVSAHLTLAESCAVLIHELAHRLARSERYAGHNARRLALLDPRAFNEALACAVERLYLEAGGTGLLPPRH